VVVVADMDFGKILFGEVVNACIKVQTPFKLKKKSLSIRVQTA
jgi:hypothetical protein